MTKRPHVGFGCSRFPEMKCWAAGPCWPSGRSVLGTAPGDPGGQEPGPGSPSSVWWGSEPLECPWGRASGVALGGPLPLTRGPSPACLFLVSTAAALLGRIHFSLSPSPRGGSGPFFIPGVWGLARASHCCLLFHTCEAICHVCGPGPPGPAVWGCRTLRGLWSLRGWQRVGGRRGVCWGAPAGPLTSLPLTGLGALSCKRAPRAPPCSSFSGHRRTWRLPVQRQTRVLPPSGVLCAGLYGSGLGAPPDVQVGAWGELQR